jgi:transketolase
MFQTTPVSTTLQLEQDVEQLCVNTIRGLAMDAIEQAKSGHPGMPLGIADAAYTLWTSYLKHNPADPQWVDRDRFVLSAGHGSMLLYSLLHLTGYDLPIDEIKRFRQWRSRTPGHPEYNKTPGVETTTGPLGQGISNAVGMALAERHLAGRFNRPGFPIVDHHTYVIASDGDMMVGISHEAASLAGHLKLSKLIVLYDSNRISIDGSTDLTMTEDVGARFEAYGWQVQTIDGHSRTRVAQAIEHAQADTERPSLIVCQTHIGFGSPNKQGSASSHGAPLGKDEVALTKQALGWPESPTFYVPEEVARSMGRAVEIGKQRQQAWEDLMRRYRQEYPDLAQLWDQMWSKQCPEQIDALLPVFEPDEKGLATRSASGKAINALADAIPGLLGGSADLHGSNNTLIKNSGPLQDDSITNRNIYYGVREHAMGAMMNGMTLHGGIIPYGGTFLIFSDYMRPAIRMAAMMKLQTIFVFSHDSIGVGEDGPTHQPIEQLSSLRLIPNLHVIRPADPAETAQAWRAALEYSNGPTALVLTRQVVPMLEPRDNHPKYGALAPASGLRRGGYVLSSPENPDVILIASGSEVALALDAAHLLAEQQIAARVVSMPCREVFAQQDQAYRDSVLPPHITARVVIEAGTPMSWETYAGPQGRIIGIDGFGASGPYKEVFEQFGFTPERVAAEAAEVVQQNQ